MDVLLDKYLRVIDRAWVGMIDRRACQLIDEGWKVECYDLEGRYRKCFFIRNGETTWIVAPARRWWHWMIDPR
jgi:hypothetical protein